MIQIGGFLFCELYNFTNLVPARSCSAERRRVAARQSGQTLTVGTASRASRGFDNRLSTEALGCALCVHSKHRASCTQ
jgi:hypothetical protein